MSEITCINNINGCTIKLPFWKALVERNRGNVRIDDENFYRCRLSLLLKKYNSDINKTTPESYVPIGRSEYLPLNSRSGWELVTKLEKYKFKVRGLEFTPERDLVIKCNKFIDSDDYKKQKSEEIRWQNIIRARNEKEDEIRRERKKLNNQKNGTTEVFFDE